MVLTRILGCLEKQRRILLVLAIDYQCIEMLVGQLLHGRISLGSEFHGKFQFAQNLRDQARTLLIGAEKQRFIAHTRMLGNASLGHQVTDVTASIREIFARK